MTNLSHTRFLTVYSAVVTAAFVTTVFCGIKDRSVSASSQSDANPVVFDQITVHRINVVEPDGTTRLVIADKAEFPGFFYRKKESSRADRTGEAGMLFMNDEGTENGGLIFGGSRESDGQAHSWGHLSFDEYEQDQAFSVDMQQHGTERSSRVMINDNGSGLISPEVLDAFAKAKTLPQSTPEQRAAAQKVIMDLLAKYPINVVNRASLGRERDASAALHLRDVAGHDRIVLRVAADGTPQMRFLDAAGKVTAQWPEKSDK